MDKTVEHVCCQKRYQTAQIEDWNFSRSFDRTNSDMTPILVHVDAC